MAGYTDFAFRKVLRKCGARITWTEMISTAALFHGSKKTKEMLKYTGKTIVQIFGHNPTHFESVIKTGIFDKFAEININMGCPARKIISNGDGAALIKNPGIAKKIIETCVKSTKKPISVKTRLDGGVEFAKMCEAAGASRLIIHGRTTAQGYSGTADWNAIAEIVRAVKIPVVANGDVRDATHAAECIAQTGAAGVMIGRALIGAPWAVERLNFKERRFCNAVNKPSFEGIKKIIRYHLKHADNILEMRKHLVAYANHLPNGKELKKRLVIVESVEEAEKIIGQIVSKQLT